VLVWFHADDKLREKPQYEPFTVNTHLEYRGESINYVNCHIQDIPENGADLKHFFYVHTYPLAWLKCLKFKWKLKWSRGDDPDLIEKTRVEDPFFQVFKENLYKKFINNENKKYLSILNLENTIVIFGKEFSFFNLTGF